MNTIHTNICRAAINSIARRASALIAFGGLLTLSHTAAKAEVIILSYAGSSQTVAPTSGTTGMRFLVYNTDGYTVSNVKMQATLNSTNDFTTPTSSAFSLGSYQTKWVTLAIPANGVFGRPLLNQPLTGFGYIVNGGNTSAYNVSFINVAPAPDIQSGNPVIIGVNNGIVTYKVPFTNNGYAASQPQLVKVNTWLYADGPVGPTLTQTETLLGLTVGQTRWLTFTRPTAQGYEIHGTIQVGNGTEVGFSL